MAKGNKAGDAKTEFQIDLEQIFEKRNEMNAIIEREAILIQRQRFIAVRNILNIDPEQKLQIDVQVAGIEFSLDCNHKFAEYLENEIDALDDRLDELREETEKNIVQDLEPKEALKKHRADREKQIQEEVQKQKDTDKQTLQEMKMSGAVITPIDFVSDYSNEVPKEDTNPKPKPIAKDHLEDFVKAQEEKQSIEQSDKEVYMQKAKEAPKAYGQHKVVRPEEESRKTGSNNCPSDENLPRPDINCVPNINN